jgi:hypothetical protein
MMFIIRELIIHVWAHSYPTYNTYSFRSATCPHINLYAYCHKLKLFACIFIGKPDQARIH